MCLNGRLLKAAASFPWSANQEKEAAIFKSREQMPHLGPRRFETPLGNQTQHAAQAFHLLKLAGKKLALWVFNAPAVKKERKLRHKDQFKKKKKKAHGFPSRII